MKHLAVVFLAVLLVLVQGCFFRPAGMSEADRKATAAALQATYQARQSERATAESVTPTPSLTPTPRVRIHIIQSGETLSVIAKRYGVSVDDLIMANNIHDPTRLRTGQEIIIPEAGSERPRPTLKPLRPEETPTPPQAEIVPCISWKKAPQEVGQRTCVYGVVINVYKDDDTWFVDFTDDPSSFHAVIPLEGSFDSWLGACILVLGDIEFDGERPYITISDLVQVQSCDNQPLPLSTPSE